MFDSDLNLISISTYRAGILIYSKEYYKDGNIKIEANWAINNRYNGLVRRYDQKGNLTWDGMYELGLRTGEGIEYWDFQEAGRKVVKKVEGFWKKGKIDGDGIKIYNNKGVLRFCGRFVDGEKEGVGRQYHWNGAFEFEGTFKNGKLNMRFVRMFSDMGFVSFEGKYRNGFRSGYGKVYDMDGKLRVFGFFDGSHAICKKKPYFVRNAEGGLVDCMGRKVY